MKVTEEQFREAVKNHQMTIDLDDGRYRCLTFRKPENAFDQHFNITTWPGYLCISGDMGCFVFARLPDMFEFFRSPTESLGVNPGYWSEKLQAESIHEGTREFSEGLFRQTVRDWVAMQLDDTPASEVQQVSDAVLDEIGEVSSEGEAIRKVMEMDTSCIDLPEDIAFDEEEHPTGINPADLDFTDFWEVCVTEYTTHFIWCLRAIVWAIQQYDSHKAAKAA